MKNQILLVLLHAILFTSCNAEKAVSIQSEINENSIDTMAYAGIERTFLLHVPPSYQAEKETPLVVAIHGYSGSATWYENDCKLSNFADENDFLVLYPNGLRYPWNENNPRAWNVGGPWETWTGGTDDVGYISSLIDLICKHYEVDEERIYLVGGSNGSMMTFRLAIEIPCKIAAIACFAGQMILERKDMPKCNVPVVYFHCSDDPAVPVSGFTVESTQVPSADSLLNKWAFDHGSSSPADTIISNEDITIKEWRFSDSEMKIKYYNMTRGGHNWPTLGNSGVAGNDSIWNFLRNYSRSKF